MRIVVLIPLLVLLCLLLGCSSLPPVDNRARLDYQPLQPAEGRADRGSEPFVSEPARRAFGRTCAGCHGPDGRGITQVGPDLRRAQRRTAAEWDRYLRDSRGSHPAGQPPPLWITEDEMKEVAAYVDSLIEGNP
jgi:mono/diheme cytochrome c family protein